MEETMGAMVKTATMEETRVTVEMEEMEVTEELLTFRRCLAHNRVVSHLSDSVV
jgi:hypothetical protein